LADTNRMVRGRWRSCGGNLLFNAAGLGDDLVSVQEREVDRWLHVLDVNLRDTYPNLKPR
jgi:hypothetical protein